jgi:hypothetical protein
MATCSSPIPEYPSSRLEQQKVDLSQTSSLKPEHPPASKTAVDVAFEDPDGNAWIIQEVTHRLPGRIDPETTTFASANDLAVAMRRAAAAHGEHEKSNGQPGAKWTDWYEKYMAEEQSGTELPI